RGDPASMLESMRVIRIEAIVAKDDLDERVLGRACRHVDVVDLDPVLSLCGDAKLGAYREERPGWRDGLGNELPDVRAADDIAHGDPREVERSTQHFHAVIADAGLPEDRDDPLLDAARLAAKRTLERRPQAVAPRIDAEDAIGREREEIRVAGVEADAARLRVEVEGLGADRGDQDCDARESGDGQSRGGATHGATEVAGGGRFPHELHP